MYFHCCGQHSMFCAIPDILDCVTSIKQVICCFYSCLDLPWSNHNGALGIVE